MSPTKQKFLSNTLNFTTLYLIMCCFGGAQTSAQDAVFSQFYASGLYLNPALGGLQPDISLGMNHRVQWTSIAPYTTSQLSFIYPLFNKKNPLHEHWGGTGLSLYYDQAGRNTIESKGISANFSYNVVLGSHQVISFGMQGGAVQERIDPTHFDWGSKYTTGNNFDEYLLEQSRSDGLNSKMYPEVSGGLLWYLNPSRDFIYKKFTAFLGVSSYHLNTPDRSFLSGSVEKLLRTYKTHGGMEYQIAPKVTMLPNFILVFQNGAAQINTGTNLSFQLFQKESGLFSHTELLLGGWYRWQDAAIVFAGVQSKAATIGFSYDMNTAGFKYFAGSNRTYEISLSIRVPKSLKHMRYYTPRI